jgi:hypothetical protein
MNNKKKIELLHQLWRNPQLKVRNMYLRMITCIDQGGAHEHGDDEEDDVPQAPPSQVRATP